MSILPAIEGIMKFPGVDWLAHAIKSCGQPLTLQIDAVEGWSSELLAKSPTLRNSQRHDGTYELKHEYVFLVLEDGQIEQVKPTVVDVLLWMERRIEPGETVQEKLRLVERRTQKRVLFIVEYREEIISYLPGAKKSEKHSCSASYRIIIHERKEGGE